MSSSLERAIHERAYSIWEQEGRPNGKHLDHWLRAEAEIISFHSQAATTGTTVQVRMPIPLEGQTSMRSVARLSLEVIPYSRRLLTLARSLIDQGEHSIAVVVAHMACEVATEQKLSEAFVIKGVQYLEDAITNFFNGYNLGNERLRDLYVALTRDSIQNEPFWSEFKASVARRNDIIHWGAIVGAVDAERSYRAANNFLRHLKF